MPYYHQCKLARICEERLSKWIVLLRDTAYVLTLNSKIPFIIVWSDSCIPRHLDILCCIITPTNARPFIKTKYGHASWLTHKNGQTDKIAQFHWFLNCRVVSLRVMPSITMQFRPISPPLPKMYRKVAVKQTVLGPLHTLNTAFFLQDDIRKFYTPYFRGRRTLKPASLWH